MSQQWADRVPCRRLRLQGRLRRARRHTMSGTARPAAAKWVVIHLNELALHHGDSSILPMPW